MQIRRRTAAALFGIAAVAGLTAFVGLPRSTEFTYYSFRNQQYTNQCMDVYQGSLADGNHIDGYVCQNSVNQKFERQSDGHVKVQNGQTGPRGYQMCMDYYPTNGSVGSPVKIWPCRPLTGPGDSQHWYYLASGQWLGGSGNCIALNSGTNGTQLVMAACNPNSPPANQRWTAQ
ncbi:MAG TPA: RICIN domain-containing protein [Longimicrobium sp.]|jgi:hypothetical protein|uniref:RICIN domain-containing protein n=1 Tax=Longimicrobium sp. TaxID=2029185 RepID=UPI002EDB936E